MAVHPVLRWSGVTLSRRFARSIPWLGALFAVAAVGAAIRRKGVVGGVLDTSLNATPFLGAAKNVAEIWRGRDFVPDRPPMEARNGASRERAQRSLQIAEPASRAGSRNGRQRGLS